jgi:hypothetical protein
MEFSAPLYVNAQVVVVVNTSEMLWRLGMITHFFDFSQVSQPYRRFIQKLVVID